MSASLAPAAVTIKRAIDLVVAGLVLVACLPLLAAIAVCVWAVMGRPVWFRDLRAGQAGRPFLLTKFRTMTDARDADGVPLPDDRRLTDLGRFLRRSSLDELPQLFQVLTGEMSLVGPRPLPVRYVSRYTDEQRRRLQVKPGITGLAQTLGRNALDWERRLALDVWYVDHWTLWLDLRLLLTTLVVVVRGHGVAHPGHVTMPEFWGTIQ